MAPTLYCVHELKFDFTRRSNLILCACVVVSTSVQGTDCESNISHPRSSLGCTLSGQIIQLHCVSRRNIQTLYMTNEKNFRRYEPTSYGVHLSKVSIY